MTIEHAFAVLLMSWFEALSWSLREGVFRRNRQHGHRPGQACTFVHAAFSQHRACGGVWNAQLFLCVSGLCTRAACLFYAGVHACLCAHDARAHAVFHVSLQRVRDRQAMASCMSLLEQDP